MSERVRNNAQYAIPDDPELSTYRFIIVAAKRAQDLLHDWVLSCGLPRAFFRTPLIFFG